jgi:protein O-GlcNAc transferase
MATIAEAQALAWQHYQAGNYALMEQVCRQSLQVHPDSPDLFNVLGAALAAQGRHSEAVTLLRDLLRAAPDAPEIYNNLGIILKQMGHLAQAEACFRDAVRLAPDTYQAHNSLGLVLAEQGRNPEAVACYEQALRLCPDYFEALINLGDVLQRMGRPAEAEERYRHGVRLRPDRAVVHNNLGVVLNEQGKFADAERCYRAALRLVPRYPHAHYNLGTALAHQGKMDEALACYEEAVRLSPDYADALNNLGSCYQEQGRVDEALACYRRALAAQPGHPSAYSNYLFALHYPSGYDPEVSLAEHLRWARQFDGVGEETRASDPLDLDPHGRLRVGYVSGDFREHVLGRYSEAFITAHDRGQFEVFCYANVQSPDERTRRIQAAADHWRSLVGVSDEEAAEQIRQDRIDLLIDLAGLTRGNRLAIFARKPAPIQASNFGYPASTGLAAIDYRITDSYCDPPGWTERYHRGKLVRLPDFQWCYVPGLCPEISPLPAQRSGAVTFASLNNLVKVTDEMLAIWAQVLQALPESRMLVLTGAGSAGDARVLRAFRRYSIESPRLVLVGKQPREGYFRLYQGVDICLDTFPFNGCTTTADALWMGVPVVTLAGKTWVSRQGVGVLTQVGLEDLITQSPTNFIETATRLAHDLPRLAELRPQLRERVRGTLGNVARFTRQLEAAYRDMWQHYCATSR